jgi:hypothetical protein
MQFLFISGDGPAIEPISMNPGWHRQRTCLSAVGCPGRGADYARRQWKGIFATFAELKGIASIGNKHENRCHDQTCAFS